MNTNAQTEQTQPDNYPAGPFATATRELIPFFETMGEFLSERETYGYECESSIEVTNGDSYDGFMSHTDGSVSITTWDDLGSAQGRGMSGVEEEHLGETLERVENDCAVGFASEHLPTLALEYGDEEAAIKLWEFMADKEEAHNHKAKQPQLPEMPAYPAFWETAEGRLQESLWDYHDGYLREGCEYYWKVRAHFYDTDNLRNKTGKPEVYLFCAINTDFTYGRDSANEILADLCVPVAELNEDMLEELADRFQDSMS